MMRYAAATLSILMLSPVGASAQKADYEAALCKRQKHCDVVSIRPAGFDIARNPIEVVELGLGRENPEGGNDCRPRMREFWVAVAGKISHLMMRLCNDGYGAAGLGEDRVRVFRNRMVHEQSGGSAWRWSVRTRYRLVPPQRVHEQHCSFHNIAPGFTVTRWNWRKFSGEVTMRYKDDGASSDGLVVGCYPHGATHRYQPIPRLDTVEGLGEGEAPELAGCASRVREDGSAGYIVAGDAAEAGGAEMRVLRIGERELLITVMDETIESGGASWVHDDHVEIWQAGLMSIDTDYLEEPPLRQWGVRLGDGAVYRGAGDPESLPTLLARRAVKRDARWSVTLRLRLVGRPHSLSVVYSNSRNGRQHRLIGTSPVVYGKARTLGAEIDVTAGTECAVRSGRVVLLESGIVNAEAR